jgi:biotin carboxylase
MILAEDYIPGKEVALEGILEGGELRVLALFDKPDPMEGPYFEETIYVTPSRLPDETQETIADTAARALRALGIGEGPVHVELRVNEGGAWVIDVAARSIGGRCSRALRFEGDASLEGLILGRALGREAPAAGRMEGASGVMMIPIPGAGILRGVDGEEEALAVEGVEEVEITIHPGGRVLPLPEGDRYLGFIFARGESTEKVEAALRAALDRLRFRIEPE